MTLNIKACEVSEVERLLLLLIPWVEKTTAVLLLARTLPVDSQGNPVYTEVVASFVEQLW